MPPIFKHKLAPKYVNPFFLSAYGMRLHKQNEKDENYARELAGHFDFGLRTDYPYRATLDGVLKELRKRKKK